MDLLTCHPNRILPRASAGEAPTSLSGQIFNSQNPSRSARRVKIWPGSILDEACSDDFPCRRFVSHRHCQYVLDRYLVGDFRGSLAAVPINTSVLTVLVQVSMCAPNVIREPAVYLQLTCSASAGCDRTCGHLTICVLLPCVLSLAQGFCNLLSGLFFGLLTFEVCDIYVPALFHISEIEAEDEAEDDGEMEMDEDYSVEQLDEASSATEERVPWLAFWNIPLVRFVAHAAINLAMIILLILILHSPRLYKTRCCFYVNEGVPSEADALLQIDLDNIRTGQLVLEGTFWLIYLGRVFEEAKQFALTPTVYLKSFWVRSLFSIPRQRLGCPRTVCAGC
jgi:hypothetical protein